MADNSDNRTSGQASGEQGAPRRPRGGTRTSGSGGGTRTSGPGGDTRTGPGTAGSKTASKEAEK